MDSTKEKQRVHLKIMGRVQGVSFRWYTRDKAEELGISGWVRNMPDGSVELVAEAGKELLNEFVEWCKSGPSLARVDEVSQRWEEGSGEFDKFSIRI
jgi:acylphosphatase